MGLSYKISDKKLLDIRNKIFAERGIPALYKNGFKKSPFSTAWYGWNNLGDFTYELCRVGDHSNLEIITTHISKGDSWIKLYLNIFQLNANFKSLEQLNAVDGLQYHIPPNSTTKMRLRIDDTVGPPIFRILFGKAHKIGSYFSKNGLDRKIMELSDLIEKDMNHIDYFVKRWYEIYHEPARTTWDGHRVV
jgi:hypothetical protein